MADLIEVHIVQRVTYTFPSLTERCSAHAQALCVMCARNPGDCSPSVSTSPSCGTWEATGMHWDTCPNRIRTPIDGTS